MEYEVPDMNRIQQQVPRWVPGVAPGPDGPLPRHHGQSTIPRDPDLLLHLRMIPGARVLSIASYYGDWAMALHTVGASVDYTDVSPEFVSRAQALGTFSSCWRADYVLYPDRPKVYDWTFSYEPVGGSSGGLPISLVRSLLNHSGAVFLFYPEGHAGKERRFPQIFSEIAEIYGASAAADDVRIKAVKHDGSRADKAFRVHWLLTNSRARTAVEHDLGLLESLDQTACLANSSRELSRLSRLAGLLQPWLRRRVTVNLT